MDPSTPVITNLGGSGLTGALACVAAAWQAHEAELRGYLRHRLTDAEAAADVLQDVFVKAMRQGKGFCLLYNPRAWLFQVARNALVDRLRVAHWHEPLTDTLAEVTEALAPVDALAECVARTIAELQTEDADSLRACDLDGRTEREYAQAHGLSLPAAKSPLLRAPAPARPPHEHLPRAIRGRRQRMRPCRPKERDVVRLERPGYSADELRRDAFGSAGGASCTVASRIRAIRSGGLRQRSPTPSRCWISPAGGDPR